MSISQKRLTTRTGLLAVMLLLTIGLGLFLYQTMLQKQQGHFSEHQSTFDTAYRASIQMYHLAIESFYTNAIDRPEILQLLETAVNSQGRQRDLARGRLYRQLTPAYQAIKADIPLQLQFYLPDGTSLLRFHKPDRYGDPLLEFQNSVRQANLAKKPVHGFETGKVRSGFRYVYPLTYQGRHLGSVSASVTAKGIRDALAELDPNREYVFLLRRNLTRPQIFIEQQWLYSPAEIHPDYLFEDANAILPDSPPRLSAAATTINRKLRHDGQVQSAINRGESLTTHAKVAGTSYLVSLLPIKNVGGQTAGYLVSYALDPIHITLVREFAIYLSTMLLAVVIISVLLLRLRRWAMKLSTEERNLQAMNHALAEGVYVTNQEGLIDRINPAACKMLGYSEQELLGKSAHDLLHCHSGNHFLEKEHCSFFLATSQGRNYDGEERFRQKSDDIRMVKVASRPIKANGQLLGAVTAFHDITARKRTEEQLRRSEETARKLSMAVDQSPTAVVITDLAGTIEYANPRLLEMTGYDSTEVIGSNPRLFQSGQMPLGLYKELWRKIESGHTWKGEFLNRRKSGELYWELCAISPVRDSSNCVTHYIAIKEDISERKHMEETLRENERIQATLIESLPVPLVIIDAASRVIENVNPAAALLIGAEEDQIIGRRCHQFLCPAQTDSCPILDLHQDVDNSEKVLLQSDGNQVPVLKTVKKITIRGREKLLECMMDIRNRLEAEEALHQANCQLQEATAKAELLAKEANQANQAKSTFLASMSHEIRTPLNAILGYSQLLQQEKALTPGQREQIQTINRSGDHLLELINNILEMSRIEAGHSAVHKTPLDFRQLMADLASMFKLSCQKKSLQFEMLIDEDLPRYLAADRAKIRQVLINLLSNAVKFTAQGRIAVQAGGSKDHQGNWNVVINISDTGSGIDRSEQHKLFEAFEQTSSGRVSGQSTGLGLSISRAYAKKMGGDVCLLESEVEKGSRFRFTFSAKECAGDELQLAHDTQLGQVNSIAPQYLPVQALIVEDNRDSRNMLEQTLSRVGFSVEAVASAEEALKRFVDLQPALVLMDIHMPGMDGYRATRKLRSLPGGQQAKIVIVTASGLDSCDLGDRTRAAGADDFLSKPFDASQLYAKLKTLCDLDYLYSPAPASPPSSTPDIPVAEMMNQVSVTLITALRKAVEYGDMIHFKELLDQPETAGSSLQAYLASLADRYEYERLLDLLNGE